MSNFADRVKETTTTTGTGTIDLAGTTTGFDTFVTGIGNGNTCYYAIVHHTLDEWEVGIGTVTDATPDTLSRDVVLASSNAGAAVSFSAGTKDVFVTIPAAFCRHDGIAVTFVSALALDNLAAATVGVQIQQSPSIGWFAHVWNPDSSTSQPMEFRQTLVPLWNSDKSRVESRYTWAFKDQETGSVFVDSGYIDDRGIIQAAIAFLQGPMLSTPDPYGFFSSNGTQWSAHYYHGLEVADEDGALNAQFTVPPTGVAHTRNLVINYYGDYVVFIKKGSPDHNALWLQGGATTTGVLIPYGKNLTSGPLYAGKVPESGFTGDLIKITDDAGSPVTKFRVTAGGGIVPRIASTASSAAPTPNADTTDQYILTALAEAATFGAPTGTPLQGQKLIIRIKDSGGAQTLAWNGIYRAIGVLLPTTTTTSKLLYVGMVFNDTDDKWDVLAVSEEE